LTSEGEVKVIEKSCEAELKTIPVGWDGAYVVEYVKGKAQALT
jgi:hypothetical protein